MTTRCTHRAFRGFIWTWWAILWLLWTPLSGTASETTWIINTDRSVEKYRAAEDAFKATWTRPTTTIDLRRSTPDQLEIERRLARTPPMAVYCIGSKAYLFARQHLGDQVIVLSSALNWESLPGTTNCAVIANEVSTESQLTMFRHIFPEIRRIGLVYSRSHREAWAKNAVITAAAMDMHIASSGIDKSSEALSSLESILPGIDALWVVADPLVLGWANTTQELFKKARMSGIPVFTYSTAYVDLGSTLIIRPDDATIGRQAAGILARILDGRSPGNRVELPAGIETMLNISIAKECGLKINDRALDGINQIIRIKTP